MDESSVGLSNSDCRLRLIDKKLFVFFSLAAAQVSLSNSPVPPFFPVGLRFCLSTAHQTAKTPLF
jgi:hypothetical protein